MSENAGQSFRFGGSLCRSPTPRLNPKNDFCFFKFGSDKSIDKEIQSLAFILTRCDLVYCLGTYAMPLSKFSERQVRERKRYFQVLLFDCTHGFDLFSSIP